MNGLAHSSSSILREWDQASSSRRTQLLQWMLTHFHSAQHNDELETECGAEISLLLPRIIVWMDKTRQHPKPPASATDEAPSLTPLDTQLACLQLFLSSSNAHKYVLEFIHADGLRVLLHILETDAPPHHNGVSTHHRCTIYSVLTRLVQRGHELKAQTSRLHGELSMVRGAIATLDHTANLTANLQSRVWTLCRMTLLEQMVGNRAGIDDSPDAIVFMLRHALDIVRLFGAQILRALVSESSFFFDEPFRQAKQQVLVPLSVELLHATSVPLQHEGLALVHALLQLGSTMASICGYLANWIHDAAIDTDPTDPAFATMKHTREYETYTHLRSAFVRAAQSLTTLMNSTPSIIELLVETHEVLIPMAFVLTVERPQSLKWRAALAALHFVFHRCQHVAASHLSQLFLVSVEQLSSLPDTITMEAFADELLRDDDHREAVAMQFFRNGWVRAMPPSSDLNQNAPSGDDDGNVDDPSLTMIEYEIDEAVHRVVPKLQVYTPFEGEEGVGNEESGGDTTKYATDNQLRQQLERHFMKFRHFSTSTVSPSS